MYIKGCENSTKHESEDAREGYRKGWQRIFGNKETGVCQFPSGKGVFDDKTGAWVDSVEYNKTKVYKQPAFIYAMDHPNPIEIVRQDPKTMKVEKRFNRTKIYR